MASHDRVLSYGKTYEEKRDPLILVIGREPSFKADNITSKMGRYDFNDVHPSSFWNVIYRYLAPAAGISDAYLKELCSSTKTSPIVVGDALPIGVKNGDDAVSTIRAEISECSISAHVKNTLDLSHAKDRVKLVLLAGHLTGARGNKEAAKNLSLANEIYKSEVRDLNENIRIVDLPFMSNLNSNELTRTLSEDGVPDLLQNILEEFYDISLRKAA